MPAMSRTLRNEAGGLYREKDQVAAIETVNYFRAAGEEHIRDKIATLSELTDETAIWQPHRDGNCALTLGTDAVTPVFRFKNAQTDSACDMVLKVGTVEREETAPFNGAGSSDTPRSSYTDDVSGAYGPDYCPMPRSSAEAEAFDRPPNPKTITEARALEAERPLTAEEAQKSVAHSWGKAPLGSKLSPGQLAWIRRLESGDLTGS